MLKKIKSLNKKGIFYILSFFVLIITFFAYTAIKKEAPFIDEYQHYESIKEISHLKTTQETFLRNAHFPGYYLLMGFSSFLLKNNSLETIRLLNTLFAVISVYVFYLIAKEIDRRKACIKTFQYFFLPILFPFFFLIYNDVLSLLLILLSFLFLMKKRYDLSGFIALFSLSIRQNNIIWIGFLAAWVFFEKYQAKINLKKIWGYLKDIKVFLFSFLILLTIVIVNKGATFGEGNQLSQPISFHLGNVYFSLFLFFILFSPLILNIGNLKKIYRFTKNKPYLILIIGLFFLFYLKTFKVDHLWNSPNFNFFLRNAWLNYFISGIKTKILFFIPIVFSILSLATIRLKKKSFYLLYPFAIFFLCLSWLIEPRYNFIPYTFFILFRKQESFLIESFIIFLYVIMSVIIFSGILQRCFFP